MEKDKLIDTIVLGCTHYPLIANKIKAILPGNIKVLCQGPIVAESLADYLNRHPEIESKLSKNGSIEYLTTEHTDKFDTLASLFLGKQVESQTITISER